MKIELLSITSEVEKLIESVGRTSYQSFDRMKEGSEKDFIRMIIKNRHYAVLEFASATFRISDVSRVFSHQWVRHRICSHLQASQRFVEGDKFSFVEPDSIQINDKAHLVFTDAVQISWNAYQKLRNLGIKKEDARFVLLNACETELVTSANLREWRHILLTRGSLKAQWECRHVSFDILEILKREVPTVFEDFVIENGRICVIE